MQISRLPPLVVWPHGSTLLRHWLSDAGVILLCAGLALQLIRGDGGWGQDASVWWVLAVTVLVSLWVFRDQGFYGQLVRYSQWRALQGIAVGAVASALTLMLMNYLANVPFPRSVPFLYAALVLPALGALQLRRRLAYRREQGEGSRVLVYGAGEAGRQLVASLRRDHAEQPIAFVDDTASLEGKRVDGLQVHAPWELPRLIEEYDIDAVRYARHPG